MKSTKAKCGASNPPAKAKPKMMYGGMAMKRRSLLWDMVAWLIRRRNDYVGSHSGSLQQPYGY